jgi:hypothetical protein
MCPKPEEYLSKEKLLLFESITSLTDGACDEALNDDYKQLCRKAAVFLASMKRTPLQSGKPASWECGILYALGQLNFLFDKTQDPHLDPVALCKVFGVSRATGAAKASEVRKHLNTFPMHPDWCPASKLEKNPLAWIVEVNGIPIDARYLPREIQEEAYRKGLIPYVPEQRV